MVVAVRIWRRRCERDWTQIADSTVATTMAPVSQASTRGLNSFIIHDSNQLWSRFMRLRTAHHSCQSETPDKARCGRRRVCANRSPRAVNHPRQQLHPDSDSHLQRSLLCLQRTLGVFRWAVQQAPPPFTASAVCQTRNLKPHALSFHFQRGDHLCPRLGGELRALTFTR